MGSSSPALSNMQFLVLFSAVPVALAYVHDATGDVAVDDSPAALPYVHDATGDVAEAYVMTSPAMLQSPTSTWSPLLPPLLLHLPSLTPPTPTPTAPTPTGLLVLTSLLPPPRLR